MTMPTQLNAPMAAQPATRTRFMEPLLLLVSVGLSVFGAMIGMQLIVSLGISANTSIIGALIAIVFSRIPLEVTRRFRVLERQNLVQTAISSATFGAANSLMIPIGVPYAMGMPELATPMLIGAVIAMFVDGAMLYFLFGSKIFPATGTWPAGIATAEAIWAGDRGGRKAAFLGLGIAVGVGGAWLGVPMSAFGAAFLGNLAALTMFGIGLLVRGYSVALTGIDIAKAYIPHGLMIGAGIVALFQVAHEIRRARHVPVAAGTIEVPAARASRILSGGFLIYLAIALLISVLAGHISDMSLGMLVLFVLYAAFAAYVHELIVGIAAMHSGWFPAFAVALITLTIGILIGFPPTALAVLVGFSAATGPAFADMGYDLKTGYLLRGEGRDMEAELAGRKQQFLAAMIGFAVAAVVVLVFHGSFFAQGLIPPVDRVYAASIKAGSSAEIARNLMIWAVPGALLQWLGGSKRQLGILLSTGMLIASPLAGWAVLAGLAIRFVLQRLRGDRHVAEMSAFAGGVIAGDALFSFFGSVTKLKK
ncbi:putative Oligopeptide transporter, OPT superfamily [Cupriavidus taiwanensis]|uniref:Oligopeptide transporter, OPT superfamily n=1 Tax=Cupriavidus taiwanensis TaxID=164546 RepID=A0A375EDM8_9BURK|nr:OPT/YSL family transporter [Cupriavidus taiwanensis]SOZ68055.1 putative Oligopeptide transporter, OPT superfamily [Cupriavidus taiwanensis]SOZ68964.1 putative Oligopeptide transporter, OPT superfamily [Cupriavidus taiwanensis]SOZ72605.1 putative Oligopeptide transporter, OPT superfamily [Cupriavidus taiwanensis]SPA02667.1 putative Oligopeptide transporter, OPT superfamily [Cupriavidus taiwanensis]SPA09603.1 putative Oligopeptide transporter, OPT superfamily [Cupriavidus taiwanensis]